MILQGLLSGLILFGSVAFRTPNNPDITKDDYEISLGFKNKSIYLKRDWERELGEKYIDDELWFVYEPKGFPLYFKPEYVNKTSRDLQYGKVDTRYKRDWFSIGHTVLISEDKTEQGTSIGIHRKKKINHRWELESKFDGYYFRDEVLGLDRFDRQSFVSLNWKINDKLTLSNIFDYNDIKEKKYYKFKIGVEYEL
jgi:hypothetical protein